MRKYEFASSEYRNDVDLRDYEEMIKKAVHEIIPSATVIVEQFSYSVDPSPSKGDAIRIRRILSKSDNLGSFCILVPKLFCSEEVEDDDDDELRPWRRYGDRGIRLFVQDLNLSCRNGGTGRSPLSKQCRSWT